MKIKLGIVLSSVIAFAQAKQFTFNVVSILGPGTTLGVKYGETVKPLTSSLFPLFTGTVEADDIKDYHYVTLGAGNNVVEEEIIKRTYSEKTSIINEVFNRTNKEVTVKNLPRPFKPMYRMGSDKFQPLPKNVIYNVYAKCNDTDYTDLVNSPFIGDEINKAVVNCTINIISPESKFQSDGNLHVIGFGSRKFKKLSYGLKFDKKFLGRKAVKLRAMAHDPSLLREPVSIELFKAVGVPVQEGAYARLFINNDIFGLYSIIDSFNDRWVGAYINGDEKAKVGFSYKLYSSPPDGPFANLRYLGDKAELYNGNGVYHLDEYEKKEVGDDYEAQFARLIQFVKLYDNWVKTYGNNNSQKAIDELKKFFNIEGLLRLLAIETLIMAIDNFWISLSNASLYYNPERDNYLFIPFDFDEVMFGSKGLKSIEKVGAMADCLHWADSASNSADLFFTKNLMSHPQIKERYDVILAIATREIFNTKVLSPYYHSLADLIDEDVEWTLETSQNLKISYDGLVDEHTIEKYKENLDYNKTNYNKAERMEATHLGFSEFIELRSDSCKAYTEKVDTSNNKNISEDVDIEENIVGSNLTSGATSTLQFSLLFVLVQALLLLLY